MGTRSKGRHGVFINAWGTRQERLCDSGAFGQSEHQRIRNHNARVARTKVIQAILEVDKSITKEERQRLETQLKELTR